MNLRKLLPFIFALFLLHPSLGFSQLQLHFNNEAQSPESLICPNYKPPLKRPATPQNDEIQGLPSLFEVREAIALSPEKSFKSRTTSAPIQLTQTNDGPLRIGIWGDSHAAANFFTEELIATLGFKKDEVQSSYFAGNIGRAGVRLPIKKSCLGGGWKFNYAYNSNQDREFPIGMIRMQANNAGAYLWMDFRSQASDANMKSLEILLDASELDQTSLLSISLDDAPEKVVELHQQKSIFLDADHPFSTIKIRIISGSLSIDGMLPKYTSQARLIIDTLGIPGATAKSWTNMSRSPSFLPPYDFIILEYGTNEGNYPNFDPENYRNDVRQGLIHLRKIYPSSACILIGPTDRGILVSQTQKNKKLQMPIKTPDLLKYSKVHAEISRIQSIEAKNIGCAFWDWQAAMGSLGSAYFWAYQKPSLMAKDLIHLTVPGYRKSAQQFSQDFQLKQLINP